MVNSPQINRKQLKAARAWLEWSQQDLADNSRISLASIARFERGDAVAYDETLAALKRTLEDAGISFLFDQQVGVGVKVDARDK